MTKLTQPKTHKVYIVIAVLTLLVGSYFFGYFRAQQLHGLSLFVHRIIKERVGNPSLDALKKVDLSLCLFLDDQKIKAVGVTTSKKVVPLTVSLDTPICLEETRFIEKASFLQSTTKNVHMSLQKLLTKLSGL